MLRLKWSVLLAIVVLSSVMGQQAQAVTVRGTGTGALLGGDLTDPENDGDQAGNNYNVVQFFADQEAAFGGGEAAFNVFDNRVAGGDDKWCCGNTPGGFPHFVGFQLPQAEVLGRFTIASGNDTDSRDPRVWRIEGSNDGVSYTPIFTQNNAGASVWTAGGNVRNQVLEFSSTAGDFATPAAYTHFRFVVDATGAVGGADFQLGELEFFNNSKIPDVTRPGDFIIAIDVTGNSSSPGNEEQPLAIDNNVNTKYLNFGGVGSGFIVTPTENPLGYAVTSLTLTTANDADGRDPTSFELYGTNDAITSTDNSTGNGELWTLIATGALAPPTARFTDYPTVNFDNDTHYTSFRVVFPTLRGGDGELMQIAEARLNASLLATVPEPATLSLLGLAAAGLLGRRRRIA